MQLEAPQPIANSFKIYLPEYTYKCYNVTMSTASTVGRLEIFVASAALAAHASFIEEGFRLRDVRFFTELFLNWTEAHQSSGSALQNTQLARYVSDLVEAGFAKQNAKKKVTFFRLTRLGLLELLARIVSVRASLQPSATLFRVCFLKSYKSRLEALVAREGAHFPHSLKLELSALLDVRALLQAQIRETEAALGRIERRIEDARSTSALTKNLLAARAPFSQVVEEVEARYPYELNSTKPLQELIASIAPDQRRWELEEGNVIRATAIWEPQRALLRELLRQLKTLAAAEDSREPSR